MAVDFSYPYVIAKDTPATAIEVQGNLDALLTWIKQNHRQIDDSPLMTAQLTPPSESGNDQQVVTKGYVDTSVVPTGTVLMWAGTALPDIDKWEWCRGASKTATDPKYADLYAIIGDDYGSEGAGSFTLPDLQAKFPLGVDPGTFDEGDIGGSTGVPVHGHDATFAGTTLGTHEHDIDSHVHQVNGSTDAGGAHNHDTANGQQMWRQSGSGSANGMSQAAAAGASAWDSTPLASSPTHVHVFDITASPNVTGEIAKPTSAGTPAGTVTVDDTGDVNDNRSPFQALNYIIKL